MTERERPEPCPECGTKPGVLMADIERLLAERNALYGHVSGLLGLLQLVRGRDDMPGEIRKVLNTNHRATDAAAYLTRIVPPVSDT